MRKLILSAIVLSLVSIGCTEKQQDVSTHQENNQTKFDGYYLQLKQQAYS